MYLGDWIDASGRRFLSFTQSEALYVRELYFVGAKSFGATGSQQRRIQEARNMHVARSKPR